MKNSLLALACCILGAGLMGSDWTMGSSIVEFISHESKHINGDPIYNRISLIKAAGKDIWLMQQQQQKYSTQYHLWDRLAIVVDRSSNQVQYYQLQPGPLEWTELTASQAIPHKVTCIKCHVNGPRAIRPDPAHKISLSDQIKISLWNYKIKRYPRLENKPPRLGSPAHLIAHQQKIPLFLKMKVCATCHNDSPSGRNFLSNQHAPSIIYMLENKLMPPSGEFISPDDMMKIKSILNGLQY